MGKDEFKIFIQTAVVISSVQHCVHKNNIASLPKFNVIIKENNKNKIF